MKLEILESLYAVCRLPSAHNANEIPDWAVSNEGQLMSLSITDDEFSLVVAQACVPPQIECEKDWRAFRVAGTLDFDMVGVIAGISKILADAEVPIFVVSTFNTDYILVSDQKFAQAKTALEKFGYQFLP